MKKIVSFLFAFAMLLSTAMSAKAYYTAVDLMAGQNIDVGTVYTWSDGTNLYVRYEIDAKGWCITETHLAIAGSLDGIPQTNPKKGSITKNPIPGQFEYKKIHDPCITDQYNYTIPLINLPSEPLYIAAHANVVKRETITPPECINIVSDSNTMWSADGVSSWTNAVPCFTHTAWNKAGLEDATWIWRTYLTDIPGEYATVPHGGWYFRREFTTPTKPTTSTISINTDNTYSLSVNGSFVGTEGSMNKIGPDNHEWATVDHYRLTNLVTGTSWIGI